MTGELNPSALKVQEALKDLGFDLSVVEMAAATRTAEEAASAVGCQVAQIVKSLVFRCKDSGRPLMVAASGANRVDERKVAAIIGEKVERAKPDFVREKTGFAIGGVPPVALASPVEVLVDRDLLGHGEIWAAAGTPHAVFRLSPADLLRMTGGRAEDVRVDG